MKQSYFKFISRKSQLFSLSAVISLFLILAGYFYYSYAGKELQISAENELRAISELKITQLVENNNERRADASVISRSPFFIDGVQEWLYNRRNNSLKKDIYTRLKIPQVEFGYNSIFITSTSGEIFLAVGSNLTRLDDITIKQIRNASKNNDITLTDFYYSKTENKICLDIIAPLINDSNQIFAFILLRRDPVKSLYPVVQSWPTPSRTSETILLKKDGDSILVLNELRFKKNTALKLRQALSHSELPTVQAALGKTGFFDDKDYRDVDVIAYLSPVPGTKWFMVAKVDRDEILSELHFRAAATVLFILILIVSVTITIAWIYHFRQRNIYRTLWEQQEEFKTTLHSIGDAVLTTDNKGRVRYLNPVAEKLTGWSDKKAHGKKNENIFNIINEETRSNVDNPLQKVLSAGFIAGFDDNTLLISMDGTEIPITYSGAQIKNESGETIGAVLVFRDQSAERKSLREIIHLNRLYKMLSQSNQAIVRLKNKDHLFKEICRVAVDDGNFNLAWIGLYSSGKKRIEPYAWAGNENGLLQNILPNASGDQLKLLPSTRAHYENRIVIVNDVQNEAGFDYWRSALLDCGCLSIAATPIHLYENSVGILILLSGEINFFGEKETNLLNEVGIDISFALEFYDREDQRAKSVSALYESEEKYRRLFEGSPDAIAIYVDGKIIYANQAGVSLMRASAIDELIGRELIDFVHPEYKKFVIERIIDASTKEEPLPMTEEKLIRLDGSEVDVEVKAIPIIYDKKNAVQLIVRDITERKKMIEELMVAKERAEKSDQLKTEFMAQMSHEIRTPLHAIVGNIDYLKMEFSKTINKEALDSFRCIDLASKRMIRTIDLILNMSEIKSGGYQPQFVPIDLDSDVLLKLYQEHRFLAEYKELEFIYRSEVTESKISADQYSITQIFANLIDNAIKYSSKGKVEILLRKSNAGNLIVEVKDTGIGISKEFLPNLFDPFVQEEQGYSRRYEGNGLGLTLVKNYCDINEAKIEVESKKNAGSTFRVIFSRK